MHFASPKIFVFVNYNEVRDLVKSVVSDERAVIDEVVEKNMISFSFDCAPSHYRALDTFATDNNVSLEILDRAVRGEQAIKTATDRER